MTFHSARLRQAPNRHFFDAITRGSDSMFPQAGSIRVEDRWLVIAHVRVLQRSQHATIDDVPPEQRADLLEHPTGKEEP
jgi:hypothetical protein